MSFILDALKKSETERQQQGSAEFAGVPTSGDRRDGPPAWMWFVGVLLLINLAVLIGILLRPDTAPVEEQPAASVVQAAPAREVAESEPEPANDFSSQVAAARGRAPAIEASDTPEPVPVAPPTVREARPAATPQRTDSLALPTLQEVQARGLVSLPPLHVDIHVYSEAAEDRFVFVNMVKHKEGSRLAEGPRVTEITPEGVVLEQDGTTFLLPRD